MKPKTHCQGNHFYFSRYTVTVGRHCNLYSQFRKKAFSWCHWEFKLRVPHWKPISLLSHLSWFSKRGIFLRIYKMMMKI